jgi:hypothetical protein
VNLVKGEATVLPKPGKSFDPVLIPKAIHDAGFTATEVEVVADGTLEERNGTLGLNVPGLNHPFVLAGGSQDGALRKQGNLVRKKIRVTGKMGLNLGTLSPTLTIEDFRPSN